MISPPLALRLLSDALDAAIRTADPQMAAFQVGSSLRSVTCFPVDLDLWFIKPNCGRRTFLPHIDNLRRCMNEGRSGEGIFDATDDYTRTFLTAGLTGILSPSISTVLQFAIGPVPQPRTFTPTIYIQVCGPLSREENDYFFSRFPFHGRAFLCLNRPFGTAPPLAHLVRKPEVTFEELRQWTEFLRIRAQKIVDLRLREKCLRKILLNYTAYLGDGDIYDRAEQLLQEYSLEYGNDAIEKVCNAIFRQSLAGLR